MEISITIIACCSTFLRLHTRGPYHFRALCEYIQSTRKLGILLAMNIRHVVRDMIMLYIFLVGYVEERLWWPVQSPNIEGKKKASS